MIQVNVRNSWIVKLVPSLSVCCTSLLVSNDHAPTMLCNALWKHIMEDYSELCFCYSFDKLCVFFIGLWTLSNVSAPILNDSCRVVSWTARSITFTWSSAKSVANIVYHFSTGTSVVASTTATSATIDNLAIGSNYSFTLYATTRGPVSTSNSVICSGSTGELFWVLIFKIRLHKTWANKQLQFSAKRNRLNRSDEKFSH